MAQLLKFDKDCSYVKKWIPELKNVDNNIILNWDKKNSTHKNINYSEPIVDFGITSKRFVAAFQLPKN